MHAFATQSVAVPRASALRAWLLALVLPGALLFAALLVGALLIGALLVGALLPGVARAQAEAGAEATPVEAQAEAAARLFRAEPERAVEGGYEALFAPTFLQQVSASQLTDFARQFFLEYGRVARVEPRERQSAWRGSFSFAFERGYRVPAELAVERAPPHRITRLVLRTPEPLDPARTLAEVAERMAALPGHASFLLAEIGAGGTLRPLGAHRPEAPAAIASAFKLYVLGALVQAVEAAKARWSEVARLATRDQSLPSGFLHTWPARAPLTLHSLATLMISRSDNTATDVLVRVLGREDVEAAMRAMGHARPALNQPLLTTRELFALKSDSALAARYLAAGEAARRALLAGEVAARPHADLAPDFSKPARIEELEWFASAQDLARALAWLRGSPEDSTEGVAGSASNAGGSDARRTARRILAVNPAAGLNLKEERWRYIGYKGGSETGVINATLLLQGAGGAWFALVASQNNPAAPVDEVAFHSLVTQAARLAAGASP